MGSVTSRDLTKSLDITLSGVNESNRDATYRFRLRVCTRTSNTRTTYPYSVTHIACKRSTGGAGILTCFPSPTTLFSLGLGTD